MKPSYNTLFVIYIVAASFCCKESNVREDDFVIFPLLSILTYRFITLLGFYDSGLIPCVFPSLLTLDKLIQKLI